MVTNLFGLMVNIKDHRLIYEFFHKCSLLPWAVIHHIDGDTHNNWIWNLKAYFNNKLHLSETVKSIPSDRICYLCKSTNTFHSKKGDHWRIYNNEIVCLNCFNNTPERKWYMHEYYKKRNG